MIVWVKGLHYMSQGSGEDNIEVFICARTSAARIRQRADKEQDPKTRRQTNLVTFVQCSVYTCACTCLFALVQVPLWICALTLANPYVCQNHTSLPLYKILNTPVLLTSMVLYLAPSKKKLHSGDFLMRIPCFALTFWFDQRQLTTPLLIPNINDHTWPFCAVL